MGTRTGQYTDLPGYKDHPHAYGDKSSRTNTAQKILGSSPRVWGQGLTKHICKKRLRIIPTRMGTSDYIINKILIIWDHPHAYGDKLKSEVFLFKISGSSPRVWGQEFPMTEYEEEDRIIPTRMGTRGKNAYKCYDLWDHPHAYGDKKKINTVANQIEGSSPRVWGQVIRIFR